MSSELRKLFADYHKKDRQFYIDLFKSPAYGAQILTTYEGAEREPFFKAEISTEEDDDRLRGFRFILSLNGQTLLNCTLDDYPHCCALMLFHNFSYHGGLREEIVHDFLRRIFELDCIRFRTWFANRRVVLNAVEQGRRRPDTLGVTDEQYWSRSAEDIEVVEKAKKEAIAKSFDVIDNAEYAYPFIRSFFLKQRYSKTVDVMYNINSGYLIHTIHAVI